MRLEGVRTALNRIVDGRAALIISSKCQILRKGFAGGYQRKFVKASGGGQLHEQPAKNQFSHPHDALQYLLLGGGEHNTVLGKNRRQKGRWDPRIGMFVDELGRPMNAAGPRRANRGGSGVCGSGTSVNLL